MKVAKRGAIAPFLIMEALSKANDYIAQHDIDVVHLSLGQPGKGAPKRVADTAQKLLGDHKLGYTEACGVRELRQRIAQHYKETYGVTVPWEHIFITVGLLQRLLPHPAGRLRRR